VRPSKFSFLSRFSFLTPAGKVKPLEDRLPPRVDIGKFARMLFFDYMAHRRKD